MFCCLFFKQKTADEMRISDWSSDVCSSDLRGGEKVRNIAIVGLPRGGFSLDEMHIWTEKYDKKLAQAALGRVEKIAGQLQEIDRKSVVSGKSVAVRVDLGGSRIITKKKA